MRGSWHERLFLTLCLFLLLLALATPCVSVSPSSLPKDPRTTLVDSRSTLEVNGALRETKEIDEVEAMVACDHPVYCNNELLSVVQLAGLFNDSKTFVDMPLNASVADVLEAFSALPAGASLAQIADFVHSFFLQAGSDLETWIPDDWVAEPPAVMAIEADNLRDWALGVNAVWKQLGRKLGSDVTADPMRHSLLPVTNPFVVPGGRFREYYYWDAFWIINGLLVSDMAETAGGMIGNLLHLVDVYGFVPNGGRVYYLNRSQPPLLTQMAAVYWEYLLAHDQETEAETFLDTALPLLTKEHEFWMTNRSIDVTADMQRVRESGEDGRGGREGETYTMNRYNAHCSYPRPEGYAEDVETATEAGVRDPLTPNQLYIDLASGAETGWDYSSRWFADHDSLASIMSSNLLPVDLNAILFKNELVLHRMTVWMGKHGGDKEKETAVGTEFLEMAKRRKEAIESLLWDDGSGQWLDFDLTLGERRNAAFFYPSIFTPLWAELYWNVETNTTGVYSPAYISDRFLSALSKMDVMTYSGGLPTSLESSGQQWDFPNGWAPLQAWAVFGLRVLGNDDADKLARNLATGWLKNNYNGWLKEAAMFEKYDVTTTTGVPGGGGEYTTVVGFGWTNGLVLQLLAAFCTDSDCADIYSSTVRK